MAGLSALFGTSKKVVKPDVSGTVRMLRETVSTLEKRQTHLQKTAEGHQAQAVARLRAKDQRGAATFIQRKKMAEKEMDGIGNKIYNLEAVCAQLEASATTALSMQAMQQAQITLSAINQEKYGLFGIIYLLVSVYRYVFAFCACQCVCV